MKVNFEQLQQTSVNLIPVSTWTSLTKPQKPNGLSSSFIDQEKAQNILVNISYPYSLNRSLSPHNYRREVQSIREQLPMEESTFRFIKSSIEEQMAKRQRQIHRQNKNKLIDFTHRKIKGEQFSRQSLVNSKQKTKNEQIKVEDLIDSLKDGIGLKTTKKSIQKNRTIVKKQKYDPLRIMNHNKTENKHTKCIKDNITTKQKQKLLEQVQITYHPHLIQNKYSKKFGNRNSKGTVYSNLYRDAIKLNYKRAVENYQQQQHIDQMHNCKNRYATNKVTRKLLKNYIPFYERYDKQMQKNAEKLQKSLRDHQYDWKTGQKFFQPNLTQSRQTYRMFRNSLSLEKQSSDNMQVVIDEQRLQNYNYNIKAIPKQLILEQPKKNQMSVTNIPSDQKGSISIFLNKSVQLNDKFKDRIMNRIANIFFSQNNNYRKGVSQLSQLNHSEFQVLYPFLTSLQSFGSVNRPLFIDLLKKFYQKLTLYDRRILRQEDDKCKRVNLKRTQRIQEAAKQITYQPVLNQRSLTLSREKEKHHETLFFY